MQPRLFMGHDHRPGGYPMAFLKIPLNLLGQRSR